MNETPTDLTPEEQGRMRRYRLARFRAEMQQNDVALAVLSSPTSTMYVADTWSFPVFQSRIPATYIAVPIDGPVVQFGGFFEQAYDPDAIVRETRPGRDVNTLLGGFDLTTEVDAMARDICIFISENGLSGGKVAIENLSPLVTMALLKAGLDVTDAQVLVDKAKLIKCEEEIQCMRISLAMAEAGIVAVREALRPGMTEQSLWSVLFQVAMSHGAEWFDSRQLAAGPRTLEPAQEATGRTIAAGDLVTFDTDLIGYRGYCADLSRTFHTGPVKPSAAQTDLYRLVHDQLMHNMALFKPNATFSDILANAYSLPEHMTPLDCIGHGLGMCDEYPFLRNQNHHGAPIAGGVLEPGMVMCVEGFAGNPEIGEGVRLEQQIVIREDGHDVLSTYPFEKDLLR